MSGLCDDGNMSRNCTVSVKPLHATVRSGDCSFENGICGWKNVTRSDSNERLVSWQMAFDMHRPAELLDRTFGTSGTLRETQITKVSSPRSASEYCGCEWDHAQGRVPYGYWVPTPLSQMNIGSVGNSFQNSGHLLFNKEATMRIINTKFQWK
jgi:hypothetical protein